MEYVVRNRRSNWSAVIEAADHEEAAATAYHREYRRSSGFPRRVSGAPGLSGIIAIYAKLHGSAPDAAATNVAEYHVG
mgnify:CR=1 FL=1